MRRFASDRVASIMERLRIPDDVPIEAKMVSKSIERSQSQVESQNFEIRKNVLKYDEVMTAQRDVIYSWRDEILRSDESRSLAVEWIEEAVSETVYGALDESVSPANWDWDEFIKELRVLYASELELDNVDDGAGVSVDAVARAAVDEALAAFEKREEELTPEVMRLIEQRVVLSIIDNKWREHLSEMDYLRAGIGLRAIGQRDPLTEYQREGYEMFADLVASVKRDAIRYLFHVEVAEAQSRPQPKALVTSGPRKIQQATSQKVGRNAPCPCGSGLKSQEVLQHPRLSGLIAAFLQRWGKVGSARRRSPRRRQRCALLGKSPPTGRAQSPLMVMQSPSTTKPLPTLLSV